MEEKSHPGHGRLKDVRATAGRVVLEAVFNGVRRRWPAATERCAQGRRSRICAPLPPFGRISFQVWEWLGEALCVVPSHEQLRCWPRHRTSAAFVRDACGLHIADVSVQPPHLDIKHGLRRFSPRFCRTGLAPRVVESCTHGWKGCLPQRRLYPTPHWEMEHLMHVPVQHPLKADRRPSPAATLYVPGQPKAGQGTEGKSHSGSTGRLDLEAGAARAQNKTGQPPLEN